MKPPLLVGLAVVLGATIWASMQEDDAVEPTRADDARSAARSTATQRPKESQQVSWAQTQLMDGVLLWQKRRDGDGWGDGPRPTSVAWASLLPPTPVQVAQSEKDVPPPMAPPFPHKWLGRYNDEAAGVQESVAAASSVGVVRPVQRALVAGPSTTWVLKEGDIVDGQWRVDRIEARTMQLTYLPLNLPQTLAMK